MSLLMSSLSWRLYSVGSLTCRTIYNSTTPKLLQVSSSFTGSLSASQTREIHYPASSPKSEKKRPEYPIRTWLNDRFKLENAYHRKKFYGPDRRMYTRNGLKITWRKVLKGRHVLTH